MRLENRALIILFLVIDLILLSLSIEVVSRLHYKMWMEMNVLFFLLNGLWVVTYVFYIDLNFFDIQNFAQRLKSLIRKFYVYVSLGAIIIVLFNMDDISRTMFLGSTLCFFLFNFPVTYFYTYLISKREDGPSYKRVLVIGAGKVGAAIQAYYQLNPSQGNLVGYLDDIKPKTERFNVLGTLADFQKVFNATRFDEVIITINLAQEKKIKTLVDLAEYNGVRPAVVANYYSLFNRNFELKNLAGIPIVNIREVPLDFYIPRFWKRIFDLAFSGFALLITSPIFLIIAIAIKLESRGPVFYRPTRIGKSGAQILVYKFRSMRHSSKPSDGTRSTAVNDDRITRVGKFIRKYSLDELPQFINVFNGEMSVVGPRPHRIDLDKRFQQIVPGYMVRQYIKPGITGWAQVNGWRGPTETKYQYIARTLHDLWYIEHWNFALDIYIIFLTLFGKNTRKNAF
jgi:putative colanic acid biosysnthesis UDP-glucose lipid carrier transferase